MNKRRKHTERDFVDEMIAESTGSDPSFPALLAAAAERRRLGRELARRREKLGVSQATLATRMGTSQAQVSKIESGAPDVRLSTLERYATALGGALHLSLRKRARSA